MANQIDVTNYSLYAVIGAPPSIRVTNFSLYAIVNHNTPPTPRRRKLQQAIHYAQGGGSS